MSQSNEQQILDTWHHNASPWAKAIERGAMESRVLVTNAAVVDAVLDQSPKQVLDIGCGEGWLVRELEARGIDAIGIDAVPELIDGARAAGAGQFLVGSYRDISAGKFDVAADVVVCNFSLLGEDSVDKLIATMPTLLNAGGRLVIQTLHPPMSCGDEVYQSGWREGSWCGLGREFSNPAPWFFRTISDWIALLTQSGFQLAEIREPLHPQTGKPASIIFIAELVPKG